nr:reverse transcriptase domain-containing protein [Tanacetum cinerariifolium]
MAKYGVTHRLSTTYHPQTSRQVEAYKNSLIHKERTKKLHDEKIKNRIFNVGDQVLLFNSRLKILSDSSTIMEATRHRWRFRMLLLSLRTNEYRDRVEPTTRIISQRLKISCVGYCPGFQDPSSIAEAKWHAFFGKSSIGTRKCGFLLVFRVYQNLKSMQTLQPVTRRVGTEATRKDHFPLPFMDQMLERLAGNEYYCFLDGFFGYFQIPIDPKDQEKTTFTCPYGTFAYKRIPFGLCNAPETFQRCMMAIFQDMIEKTMEVFMDDFFVFGNSFSTCLTNLKNMLKMCEDTKLALNWEKSHFMVKEGIVLGHKISKKGIEVDKAKIEVISKLPHPTTVKGIRSFLGHAGFYRHFIKDFSKISRPMTHLLEKNSPFIFSNE